MVSIGVACTDNSAQTPSRCRINRLPSDSASVRLSSLAMPADRASSTTTFKPVSWSANASVAPTGPRPTMRMSTGSAICHPGLDLGHGLGNFMRDDLAPACRHHCIVFDTNADIPEMPGHVIRRAHVTPRFHGEHHAQLQR